MIFPIADVVEDDVSTHRHELIQIVQNVLHRLHIIPI